jgi:type II secretory pathway component GspD/PulD (secretin)
MKSKPTLFAFCLALATPFAGATAEQAALPESAPAVAESKAASPASPGLRFNFHGAPLEMVLHYMSEAAGYVVVLETPVNGTVDMWSDQPVSKEDAVQILNLALDKSGYSARVQGRTLIVSSKDQAKRQNIPIHTGNDPADIPMNADMVMQVIPLRHIDATQAAKDLASLIPSSSTLTANQDSNSLVVTDTEMNVHQIVEIVSALDTSIETVSTVRVFRLKNADPVEMAQLIGNLFGSPNPSAGNPGPFRGGPGGFNGGLNQGGFNAGGFNGGPNGGGFRGGGALAAGGNAANAGRNGSGGRAIPVVAVADPRTFSIVVNASKDQMPEIAEMISRLDSSSSRKQRAYTITMQYADVQQVQTVLQNLFQSSVNRTATTTQADPLSSRATTNAQTTTASPTINLGGASTPIP